MQACFPELSGPWLLGSQVAPRSGVWKGTGRVPGQASQWRGNGVRAGGHQQACLSVWCAHKLCPLQAGLLKREDERAPPGQFQQLAEEEASLAETGHSSCPVLGCSRGTSRASGTRLAGQPAVASALPFRHAWLSSCSFSPKTGQVFYRIGEFLGGPAWRSTEGRPILEPPGGGVGALSGLSSGPLPLAASAVMPGHGSFAALEEPGLPPKRQHACRQQPLPCCLQRGTAACTAATDVHHPDHLEVSPGAHDIWTGSLPRPGWQLDCHMSSLPYWGAAFLCHCISWQ